MIIKIIIIIKYIDGIHGGVFIFVKPTLKRASNEDKNNNNNKYIDGIPGGVFIVSNPPLKRVSNDNNNK